MTLRRPSFFTAPSKARAKHCECCAAPANGEFLRRVPGEPARYACRVCYAKLTEEKPCRK